MNTIMSENKPQPIGRMLLKDVRIAFAQGIFEASVVGTDPTAKPRFGASFLVPPDHPQLKEIEAKIKAVAEEKWKAKAGPMLAAIQKKDRTCLHDGDDKPQYDGYAGNMYVTANAQESTPPTVLNQDRTMFEAKKGHKRIYSGARVNANIEIWAQDNAFGQRVNATLRGVQFYRDADSFSAASAAAGSEFEEVTDGNDAEDFT